MRERQGRNRVDLLFFLKSYLFVLDGREDWREGKKGRERNESEPAALA